MILVHAKAGQMMTELPAKILEENDFVAFIGPDGSFDELDLLVPAGVVGGAVIRVVQLQDEAKAFEVLAYCVRLFQHILAEHLSSLHYIQPKGENLLDMETAPVAWSVTPGGQISEFYLSSTVANSPMLAPLTRDLAAQPMTDDQRFAFLAAAFAGA